MNLTATRSTFENPLRKLAKANVRSSTVYASIIILALVAFEAFNFGTTNYALQDLLGDLKFAGFRWSTLMALAFCGLDFAGIARLITQTGRNEQQKESWYLFGAWLIAATFNAALTWWGVAIAIANHSLKSSVMVNTETINQVVPILVAIMVWIIRVLIIGSLTSALERMNSSHRGNHSVRTTPAVTTQAGFPTRTERVATAYTRPAASSQHKVSLNTQTKPEPTYHNMNAAKQVTLNRMDSNSRNY